MILNGNGKLAKREITALEDSYLSFEGALAGQLLQNVDEVLQTRGGGQGLKLYSRLYNDPHIQAALNRLAGSVTCKDWIVAPGGEKRIDQKAADLVRSQLANLNAFDLSLKEENHSSVNGFDQLTRAMIVSGRLNGYVCAEVMWANRDGQTVASEIRVRDPRQFGFMRGEQGYVLRHLTRENSWTGETPPLKKILVWSYGALDGSPYGRALGEAIFWPHFFKRNIIKFNLKFLENYASPKVVGKYPRGSQTDQLATLNAAVNTIANETGISLPETMTLEYLQANASGTVDAYEKAIRYFDEQISEVILGETGSLSQSTGGGSRARDEVGAESGAMVAKAIADSLSSTFNRLARWITDFNLPQAMPPTVYRDFEAGEEITSRSGVDKILFDLGYRLTPERVADVYGSGYEQAGGDDKEPALISSLGMGGVQALTGLLTQAATGQLPKENAIAVLVSVFGIAEEAAAKMVPDAPKQEPDDGGLAGLFGGQDDEVDEVDEVDDEFAESEKDAAELIADKARPFIQDAIAPWLDQIRNFVEQATSLEEIRDGLIDLFPEMDDAAFAEAMGQAMLLGDLAGRELVLSELAVSGVERAEAEVLQDDADVAFAEAIEAALNGTLDFAAKPKAAGAAGKKPNCNPAKSHFCQTATGKGSCVPLSKKCKFKPTGATATASTYTAAKVASASPVPISPTPPPAPSSTVPANQKSLDSTRNALIKKHGQKAVEDAENNLKTVLDDADIFVRVGNVNTLQNILGDEFKNSFQLGQDTHQIPQLADKSYLKARARVEDKTLGIDAKTADGDRPIYGYLGSQDLNGASHSDPSRAYGSIAVKLKGEVKDRATFTGADSFKSGIASAVKNDGTPPPPNAASIVPATRHGYDRDKLPKNYPSYYADDSSDRSFIKAAAIAKSVDDLAPRLALTGNVYMETQIHGGVKPSDIAEIHFSPSGVSDRPNAAIAQFAKDNGVDLYVKGQKLSPSDLDGLINKAADPVSQRVKDLRSAMESGDITKVRSLAKQLNDDAMAVKVARRESDRHLKLLFSETGFDGLPTVGTEADVTKVWQDGGHLMVRGVGKSGQDGKQFLTDFQSGDYFVGSGVYGNGTYVGHASRISSTGKTVTGYNAATHKLDAKRAVDNVAKYKYISKSSVTMRMALDKDAIVVTQSELLKKRNSLVKKLDADYNTQKTALLGTGKSTQFTAADAKEYSNEMSKNRANFAGTKLQTKTISSKPRNGGKLEEQEWTIVGLNGSTIKQTVYVTKPVSGLSSNAYVVKPDGSFRYINIGKNGTPIKNSHSSIVEEYGHETTLAKNKWKVKPTKGGWDTDPADAKKIKVLDDEHEITKHALGLDGGDVGSLGRFAVLQGVDMIALDQSYEPSTFGNLLNRSKVTIQRDPLDYKKAMNTGAL